MHKKFTNLLVMGALFLGASAQNNVYDTTEFGDVNGVSDNGFYVAITDTDNNLAYLWDASNPDLFTDISAPLGHAGKPAGQRIAGTNAYDVTNDGMVVGCIIYADGKEDAAIYLNGEWETLPRPLKATNTCSATCVTPDGKTIGGYYCTVAPAGDFGQYRPCQWKLNEDGEYELFDYPDILFPDHQGFITMTQSTDGRVLGGPVYCGYGSTVPGLIIDGELKLFDEITTRYSDFQYQGKWFCGYDDEGHQIWTDDPDDPRIVYYAEECVDGYYDGASGNSLVGLFDNCDNLGNFYGCRTRVSNVSDDGNEAKLTSGAAIYNINTDEWTYNIHEDLYTAGTSPDFVFTNDCTVLIEGVAEDIEEYYDFSCKSLNFGIAKINSDATVLGGARAEFFEAIGDFMYFPYVIVTEDFTSGVATTYGGAERPSVMLSKGSIMVRNAENAQLFDLNGRLVGTGLFFTPAPGAYIVKAGQTSVKVIVK